MTVFEIISEIYGVLKASELEKNAITGIVVLNIIFLILGLVIMWLLYTKLFDAQKTKKITNLKKEKKQLLKYKKKYLALQNEINKSTNPSIIGVKNYIKPK